MSASTLSLLSHEELISVNQDPLGRSVQLVWQGHPRDGLAGERLVSTRCNVTDPLQQWTYAGQLLQSVGRKGTCVKAKPGVEGRLLAVVADCDVHDEMQVGGWQDGSMARWVCGKTGGWQDG